MTFVGWLSSNGKIGDLSGGDSTRRLLRWGAACAAALSIPLASSAQQSQPRSRDYLFVSSVDDARAVWVNPAGQAWIPEASVMAELVFDRTDSSTRVGQYTLGFNSRGLAVAYQRDRPADGPSLGIFRLGLGVPLGRASLGATATSYGSTREEGFDIGLRYALLPRLNVGAVIRNLGRPLVRLQREPLVGVVGATLGVAPSVAEASWEAAAVERLATSGYDLRYRGGLVLTVGRPSPVAFYGAAELGSDGTLRGWALGILLGGGDSAGLVASAKPTAGLGPLDRFSAVGVATRRPPRASR